MKLRGSAANAKLVALGKAIRKARIARQLSLGQMAASCALRRNYLIRIEQGEVCLRTLTLVRTARALSVSVAQLLREADL